MGSNLNSNLNWIKEGIINRESQFSTVIVYETSDPKRLPQFLHFLFSSSSSPYSSQVYLFWIWRGLFRIRMSGGKIVYDPVKVTIPSSASPLVQMMQRTATARGRSTIRVLEQALEYMDNVFLNSKNVTFIIYGIHRGSDTLTSAIRAWVLDDSMYVNRHTIVIFTENARAIFDDSTLKYLIYIRIPPSSEEERREILEGIVESLQDKLPHLKNVDLHRLVQATAGLTLHETESVVLKSLREYKDLDYQVIQIFKNDIVMKSGILEIKIPKFGFEAIGGYEVIKDFVIRRVIRVLQHPEKARRLGVELPRGLLFFGPPGTGKTVFAEALAKELKIPFLKLNLGNIVSKWYGETEQKMTTALEIAESVAPCILFVDEIDRFGRRGHPGEHETTRRTFSILLEWLGARERKTIIVATTNRPQDLDKAFIRVGRFDYIIPFLFPDLKAREEILRVHTSVVRKLPLAKNVDLQAIAYKTELWTGAELEALVKRASAISFDRGGDAITMSDFEEALESFPTANLEEKRAQLQEYLALAEQFCNDVRFLDSLKRSMNMGSRLGAQKDTLDL